MMNRDKAIEYSQLAEEALKLHNQDKLAEAVRLGREALYREKMRRKHPNYHFEKLLPGETEE